MAETKEQLINIIKEWVKLDNEIRKLQTEIAKRKKEKSKISTQLISVMKQNEIDCFDLKDGQLLYTKKSVKKPITKKVLLTILNNYFNGDYIKASEINDYILSNREEVIHEKIIHKLDN
jgi:seryl-tRNA synthetase